MGKLILILLLILPLSADAARQRFNPGQWIIGQSDTNISSNSQRCYALSGGSTVSGSTVQGLRSVPTISGMYTNLSFRIHVDTAHDIGDNNQATGTFFVNGAPALSAVIQGQPGTFDREAPINTNEVIVQDGDLVEFCINTETVPSNSNQYHWSILFIPDEENKYIYPTVALFNTSSSQFVKSLGTTNVGGSLPESSTQFIVPLDGTINRVLCSQADSQVSGSRNWILRKNGVPEQTCSIQSGRVSSSDTPVVVQAGDLLSLQMTSTSPNPTSSVIGITWVWEPTVKGNWWLASSGNTGWSTSTDKYQKLHGPQSASSTLYSFNATPFASNQNLYRYVVFKGFYVKIDTAPNGGSWDINFIEYPTQNSSGAPLTTIGSCTIINDTQCEASLAELSKSTDLGPSWYEFKVTPSNSPSDTTAKLSTVVRTN